MLSESDIEVVNLVRLTGMREDQVSRALAAKGPDWKRIATILDVRSPHIKSHVFQNEGR
ncbi:MAG: hypothetical protein P1Q69_12955 [Candidatus Thorarchaeota archaeon]|nr:hypothetical protein [Candidatus Thorarchaeota archaeon]